MFINFGEHTLNMDKVTSIDKIIDKVIVNEDSNKTKIVYNIGIFMVSNGKFTFNFKSQDKMERAYTNLIKTMLNASDMLWDE